MKSLSCDWQVMFLKACVSWPYFADSAVCNFFKNEFILAKLVYLWNIYEDVSFNWDHEVSLMVCFIDCWWHFISWVFNLCAWQKSSTVMRQLACSKNDIIYCPQFQFLIFLHSRTIGLALLSLFVYMREPFKSWSSWHFDVFCVSQGKNVRRTFCLSPNKCVPEAVDHKLSLSRFSECCYVYYVYCCTYWCSGCPMHSCCRNRDIWHESAKRLHILYVYVLFKYTHGCVCSLWYT